MIGPSVPPQFFPEKSSTPEEEGPEVGPAQPVAIGPTIPPEVLNRPSVPSSRAEQPEGEEEEEDDYAPALPPDLAAARASITATTARTVQGPALPPSRGQGRDQAYISDDSDEDDYGPRPLPQGMAPEETDGVRQFIEIEERRRKQLEEASKPKPLKREEWMLVPPSASDLLGSIDPTKLNKPRQFARTAAPSRNVDSSLWTETPAERQQRIADEVSGKRRRAVNADPDAGDEEKELEAKKRRRLEEEIRRGVNEHTKKNRGATLLQQHAGVSTKEKKREGEEEGPPGIWDHSRDMALSGRLMDDKSRDKLIKEARGLGDRFGTGKSGGFL